MNNIDRVFKEKDKLLSVYFTAGFPSLNDTVVIMKHLQEAGVDMIEIGMPFSDPVADGPTIQKSSQKALKNGMTVPLLLEQLQGIRQSVQIPLVLMGYLNPVLQYGVERFCRECRTIGIDGLIIPDLPLQEWLEDYQAVFDENELYNIFLISPQTSEARVRLIDKHSSGFIYMVSSASITGARKGIAEEQLAYFRRIREMKLRNPGLIGFGISDHDTFSTACQYAPGAIIGSAFIKVLEESSDLKKDISDFVGRIRGSQ